MKEIEEFIIERFIEFEPLLKNIPNQFIKHLVTEYKKENPDLSFEEYTKNNSWMIVDSAYNKIKHYTIFNMNPESPLGIFGTEDIFYKINDYFKDIFEKSFKPFGKLDKLALLQWAKEYHRKDEKEYYVNLVNRLSLMEEPEASELFLGLFVSSLDLTVENYFDLCKKDPPSLEDAEYLINDYLDCSDKSLNIGLKWDFIQRNSRYLNERTIRRAIYRMMGYSSIDQKQRKALIQLSNMKAKKLKISEVKERLDIENQHLFCALWQSMNGL